MITIEGIDVTGLIINDDFPINILGESQMAESGSLVIFEKETLFTHIDLVGGDDWGWLTKGILSSLRNLANISGAKYVFDYEGVLSTVRFRTEDIPVIQGSSLIKRSNSEDTDYYNNIFIKLTEV